MRRLAWSRCKWSGCIGAYQGAGDVDAAISDGGVIQPFWLGETEEAVVGDVHCVVVGMIEVMLGWDR